MLPAEDDLVSIDGAVPAVNLSARKGSVQFDEPDENTRRSFGHPISMGKPLLALGDATLPEETTDDTSTPINCLDISSASLLPPLRRGMYVCTAHVCVNP